MFHCTTVKAHKSTAWDDHNGRFPHPAQTQQQTGSHSQNIDHEHAFHPERQRDTTLIQHWSWFIFNFVNVLPITFASVSPYSFHSCTVSHCFILPFSPPFQVSHKSYQEGRYHAADGEDCHRQGPVHDYSRVASHLFFCAVLWMHSGPLCPDPQGASISLFNDLW